MQRTGAILAAAMVVVACSGPVGTALTDAGWILLDVGGALDADAAAQDGPRVVEVPCDGVGVQQSATPGSGATMTRTTHYAQLDDAAIATLHPDVMAVICDRTPAMDVTPCPPGDHCTDTNPAALPCRTVPVELANGTARVACGESLGSDPDGAGPVVGTESGYRFAFARFVLR